MGNVEEWQGLSTTMAASRALLNNGSEENIGYERDILSRMHDDAVTKCVRNDELLHNLGLNLYENWENLGLPKLASGYG